MQNISTHISYKEATRSQTAERLGLPNTPDSAQLANMKLIAEKVFEPLREHMREPIRISSFFRSEKVNKAIGGSTTSQHKNGEAMDICAFANSPYTNADLFHYIKNSLEFDQLIWEFGNDRNPDWVHVSYSINGNRKAALKAVKQHGRTVYLPFK